MSPSARWFVLTAALVLRTLLGGCGTQGGARVASGADQIVLVENGTRQGDIAAISGRSVTFADGTSLALQQVRRLHHAPTQIAQRGRVRVELADSGMLVGERVVFDGQRCEVTWHGAERWQLEINDIRAIRFVEVGGAAEDAALAAELAQRELAVDDRLLVLAAGQGQTVHGAVEAVSETSIVVTRVGTQDDASLELPRDRVAGIVFAAETGIRQPAALLVTLVDGSRLACRELQMRACSCGTWTHVQR